MRKFLLFFTVFIVIQSFSQSVNDYKAVIIPLKYDFLKTDNQYRLQTITKLNLQKSGFQAFYSDETIQAEFPDRCSFLYVDVKEEKAFIVTKLFILFKDCYGSIIYKSAIGKSKEKEFQNAYSSALNDAFKSVYALNYKYNATGFVAKSIINSEPIVVFETPIPEIPVAPVALEVDKNQVVKTVILDNTNPNLLYAQPTSYGYQLIDSEPKIIMKVYKTSNPASFMAKRGDVQGALISKDKQWFFEYYQNDKLISEKIEVKF